MSPTASSPPSVRVRMAPSPTGPVTIATARTALFNWLFARKHGGSFILRIEDTDRARSEERYIRELMDSFAWLGLDWDEGPAYDADGAITSKGEYGPYLQTQRLSLYRKYLEQLLAERKAYWCYCTKEELDAERDGLAAQGLAPKYSGRCRVLTEAPPGKTPQTIRFVVPETNVEFTDLVRGKITYDAGLFGDIVIAKNLDEPLYNFAVVVDDELMQITHVLRGEDHITNTPKQLLMQRAFGFRSPEYAHLPVVLDRDRSKLSKRSADVSLLDYREKGYLPDAVNNFMALIGWHPSGNAEVFPRAELIHAFDLSRVQKSGAIFLPDKLQWLNREHLRQTPLDKLVHLAAPFIEKAGIRADDTEHLAKALAAEQNRLTTLAEFPEAIRYYFEEPQYNAKLLVWREDPPEKTKRIVSHLADVLGKLPPASFTPETVQGAIAPLIETEGKGSVLWPLRVALSGRDRSADPFVLIDVLGPEKAMQRIAKAREKLEE